MDYDFIELCPEVDPRLPYSYSVPITVLCLSYPNLYSVPVSPFHCHMCYYVKQDGGHDTMMWLHSNLLPEGNMQCPY
jgi:hypothetical protein